MFRNGRDLSGVKNAITMSAPESDRSNVIFIDLTGKFENAHDHSAPAPVSPGMRHFGL